MTVKLKLQIDIRERRHGKQNPTQKVSIITIYYYYSFPFVIFSEENLMENISKELLRIRLSTAITQI